MRAVTRNADGTVTVKVMKLAGIAGANQTLSKMGVRARIVSTAQVAASVAAVASVAATHPCAGQPRGWVQSITVDPARIPRREVLVVKLGSPATAALAPAAAAARALALARQLAALHRRDAAVIATTTSTGGPAPGGLPGRRARALEPSGDRLLRAGPRLVSRTARRHDGQHGHHHDGQHGHRHDAIATRPTSKPPRGAA